jgi:hypothetical protein
LKRNCPGALSSISIATFMKPEIQGILK